MPSCCAAFFGPISSESEIASSLNSLLYLGIRNTSLYFRIILGIFRLHFYCIHPLPGIIIGIAGMFMAIINYPIYKRILGARRKKFADKIIAISDRIMKG